MTRNIQTSRRFPGAFYQPGASLELAPGFFFDQRLGGMDIGHRTIHEMPYPRCRDHHLVDTRRWSITGRPLRIAAANALEALQLHQATPAVPERSTPSPRAQESGRAVDPRVPGPGGIRGPMDDPLVAELVAAVEELERALPAPQTHTVKRIFKAKNDIKLREALRRETKNDPQPDNRDPYHQHC